MVSIVKPLVAAFLFCALTVPVFAQAVVLPDFVTIAQGFTSPTRSSGIDVAYRMLTVPAFGKTCKESERPFRLMSPNEALILNVGEWFPLRRLRIFGVDRTSRILHRLPISLEVEDTNPPLFNLHSDMISDGRLMPIRAGRFRFRAPTICEGTSADVFIQAVVRPR